MAKVLAPRYRPAGPGPNSLSVFVPTGVTRQGQNREFARARHAALWQEDGLVPIVEPEVLIRRHPIETSNSVTEDLCGVVGGVRRQVVSLEA